jgi:formylglycine-generating enzyme required for sulfatase activity/serine/threonine protein kinase
MMGAQAEHVKVCIMLRLIRCVGRAVAVKGVRGLRGELPFDEVLFDVAEEMRRLLNEDELRNELQQICRPDAAVEVRRAVERMTPGLAADLSADLQHRLSNYLSFIPAAVRQALKRPDDATGTTVPASLPLSRPEELVVLLPAGIPHFRPGNRPAALGGWELVDLLGVGGLGEIWLAQNVRFHAIRAAVQFCLDAAACESLRKEDGQLIRRVLHAQGQLPALPHGDGIVPLQNADLTAEPPWLRYQAVEGHNLSGLLLNWASLKGPERAKGATAVVRRLARIVGQFHRLPDPIVHRDLKPANVLVSRCRDGKMCLRVGDFGTSQAAARWAIQQSDQNTPRGILAQALRGRYTPLYASPQQKQMQDPDVRDDVFALGVLWYQLLLGDLTLEPPAGAWRKRVAHLELDTVLLDLLEECVADDAALRPYDAAELAARLAGNPPSPPPAPPVVMPPPVVQAVDSTAEPTVPLSAEPPTLVPSPVLAAAPLPAVVPVDAAPEPAALVAGENSVPAPAVVSSVVGTSELAEPTADETTVPPIVLTMSTDLPQPDAADSTEVMTDAPSAPAPPALPAPVVESEDDVAEFAVRFWDEPPSPSPAPPPAESSSPIILATYDAVKPAEESRVEPPAPALPPAIPPKPATLSLDGATEPVEQSADGPLEPSLIAAIPVNGLVEPIAAMQVEPSEPPLEIPHEVVVAEVEVAAELLNDVPPASSADLSADLPLPVVGTVEVEEQSGGESLIPSPEPPPATPPAVEEEVTEVVSEWLIEEPTEPPAAPSVTTEPTVREVAERVEPPAVETSTPPPPVLHAPLALSEGDAVAVAVRLWDGSVVPPPLSPPRVPSRLGFHSLPATPLHEKIIELPIPIIEIPGQALSMRFAWVSPGEFSMGDEDYEEERPVRRVTISKGFFMGVFPVTQTQWRSVMHYNASLIRGGDHPVEMVSWTECQEFCRRMRQLTGKAIRLPTEAEWEYACRAGTTTEYCTGDSEDALRQAGWYQGNSNWQTHPVGQLAANAWGLHDMHGNVWEWCQDWYSPYSAEDETDPRGPESGDVRVLRGGSWRDPPVGCRATSRGEIEPARRYFECGSRVCFIPD